MPLLEMTINIINNLISALSIEIETIGAHPLHIAVRNGELVSSIGDLYVYKFDIENPADVPDDTAITLSVNGHWQEATIISSRGLEMMISIAFNHGNEIAHATIEINNSNLLRSLKQLLERIRTEEIQINEDIVLKLFGLRPLQINNNNNIFIPPTNLILDEYQQSAIENSANSEVSFIWGPPGTGKTVVIAILTKMLIENNLTVLVTSNTNIAVDNVFEKYIDLFPHCAELANGEIIRYGNIQVDAIRERVQESAIIKRKAAPLYDLITQLSESINPLKERQSNLAESIKEYEEYSRIKRQLIDLQNQLAHTKTQLQNSENSLQDNINTVNNINQAIIRLETELIIAKNTNVIIRFFKGMKSPRNIDNVLSQNRHRINSLLMERQAISNTINDKRHKINLLNDNIQNREQELQAIRERIPHIEDIQVANVQYEINQINTVIAQIENQIAEIRNQIIEIENNLLRDAKVIGTTLSMFHSKSRLYSRNYDVVIIDEVTMAIQPQIFFASCFSNQKILIVGDFNQLQPIIRTYGDVIVEEWLKKDIFRKNNITTGADPRLNTLRIQRRMKAPIAEISNQVLYGGILEHQPEHAELNDERAVSFYNTANFKPYATIPPRGSGRINVYNAILAIKLAQKYCSYDTINNIGIITPYRSQANLISKLIKDLNLQSKISADTVHKFQGLEKDVIIFDITDGINTRGYKLGANLRNNEAPYLFNVAFTRAKHKLIVIGDLDYLRSNHNELPQNVKNMIGSITLGNNDDYETIDSMEIINELVYANPGDDILQNFQLNVLKLFTEENFYPDFFEEIVNCNESLIIYSPFIARNRVTNYLNQEFFQNLINRDIRIKIVTKPVNEHPNANKIFAGDCILTWEEMGLTVEERKGMHEKIAIIDNRIIYHGSLNILSQWQTHETMLKIVGPNAVNELLRNYL
jgi:superfamily I DNA and/or RNA helicase